MRKLRVAGTIAGRGQDGRVEPRLSLPIHTIVIARTHGTVIPGRRVAAISGTHSTLATAYGIGDATPLAFTFVWVPEVSPRI